MAVTEVLAGGTEDAKPPKAGGFAALTAGAGLARKNCMKLMNNFWVKKK